MRETQGAPALSALLTSLAAQCLKVPAGALSRSVPLCRHGMDSLARVELTAALEAALDRRLPDSLLIEHPDLESLERYLRSGPAAGQAPAGGLARMRADSRLPAEVRPPQAPRPVGGEEPVLLTGATGFLGGYLLRALLERGRRRVLCLVRAGARRGAKERLRGSLERSGPWDPSWDARLEVVEGDVALPLLGLSEARYARLAAEVGEVYHCAAEVDWASPYGALRAANVLGTLECLRLACACRTKGLRFVSTVAVCYSTSGPREMDEDEDPFPYLPGLHLGYAQTKCVAEALVREAGERGLPVTILRPSLVAGDRASGASSESDLLSRLLRGVVRMGTAPDLDWTADCLPVDYLAGAVLHLVGQRTSPRVLHLVNPAARHWRELVLWLNLYGYPVRLEPYREWAARVATDPENPLWPLRGFFLGKPASEGGLTLPELYEDGRRTRLRASRTEEALQGAALGSPRLDARLLERYVDGFISRGLLPSPSAVRRPAGPIGGRGSPEREAAALDASFFAGLLRGPDGEGAAEVRQALPVRDGSDRSIISELTSWLHGSPAGLRQYRLGVERRGELEWVSAVVKRKASDEEAIDVARRVAEQCSPALGRAFERFGRELGLAGSHVRELGVYGQDDLRFRRHAPALYGVRRDDARQEWTLVLEDVSGLELLDSADDASGWETEHVEAAVRGLAELHAIWYGREEELLRNAWLGPVTSARRRAEMAELWAALAENAASRFASVLGEGVRALQARLAEDVGDRWRRLESRPRTLIHNDFNPRNIALRTGEAGRRLCAYDWELATLGPPQHDLAELLCFVLPRSFGRPEVEHYLALHREALRDSSGVGVDLPAWADWEEGFRLSLHDLLLDRLALYAMIGRFKPQRFLDRVVRTWGALYELYPLVSPCR
ncbi:MAG: thioester reductase domain-containing protein [Deltaproteobacteria bacterium]|nr:thioester reductase domain-containing protein [Deltaproteobacteria bacterium]